MRAASHLAVPRGVMCHVCYHGPYCSPLSAAHTNTPHTDTRHQHLAGSRDLLATETNIIELEAPVTAVGVRATTTTTTSSTTITSINATTAISA